MKIKEGQVAPHFSLEDVFGRKIDLDRYRDRKILIAFFRHAGCPFCNLRVHALTKVASEFKQNGLDMIFFFESKASVILRSSFHQEVSPIPLIADPDKTWYAAYGLESSPLRSAASHLTSFIPTVMEAKKAGVPMHMPTGNESLSTMPAEFLLDKSSIVSRVLYARSLSERLDVEEIRAFSLLPSPVSQL